MSDLLPIISNLVKDGSWVRGNGLGFAVAGPLGAGVGRCLDDFAHDFLGDVFGSEKDLTGSYGGLLGNLLAGGIQTLFSQPQDFPEFNHQFRCGLLDALVVTLQERATEAYRSTYHHGSNFSVPLNTCFHTAADHFNTTRLPIPREDVPPVQSSKTPSLTRSSSIVPPH